LLRRTSTIASLMVGALADGGGTSADWRGISRAGAVGAYGSVAPDGPTGAGAVSA